MRDRSPKFVLKLCLIVFLSLSWCSSVSAFPNFFTRVDEATQNVSRYYNCGADWLTSFAGIESLISTEEKLTCEKEDMNKYDPSKGDYSPSNYCRCIMTGVGKEITFDEKERREFLLEVAYLGATTSAADEALLADFSLFKSLANTYQTGMGFLANSCNLDMAGFEQTHSELFSKKRPENARNAEFLKRQDIVERINDINWSYNTAWSLRDRKEVSEKEVEEAIKNENLKDAALIGELLKGYRATGGDVYQYLRRKIAAMRGDQSAKTKHEGSRIFQAMKIGSLNDHQLIKSFEHAITTLNDKFKGSNSDPSPQQLADVIFDDDNEEPVFEMRDFLNSQCDSLRKKVLTRTYMASTIKNTNLPNKDLSYDHVHFAVSDKNSDGENFKLSNMIDSNSAIGYGKDNLIQIDQDSREIQRLMANIDPSSEGGIDNFASLVEVKERYIKNLRASLNATIPNKEGKEFEKEERINKIVAEKLLKLGSMFCQYRDEIRRMHGFETDLSERAKTDPEAAKIKAELDRRIEEDKKLTRQSTEQDAIIANLNLEQEEAKANIAVSEAEVGNLKALIETTRASIEATESEEEKTKLRTELKKHEDDLKIAEANLAEYRTEYQSVMDKMKAAQTKKTELESRRNKNATVAVTDPVVQDFASKNGLDTEVAREQIERHIKDSAGRGDDAKVGYDPSNGKRKVVTRAEESTNKVAAITRQQERSQVPTLINLSSKDEKVVNRQIGIVKKQNKHVDRALRELDRNIKFASKTDKIAGVKAYDKLAGTKKSFAKDIAKIGEKRGGELGERLKNLSKEVSKLEKAQNVDAARKRFGSEIGGGNSSSSSSSSSGGSYDPNSDFSSRGNSGYGSNPVSDSSDLVSQVRSLGNRSRQSAAQSYQDNPAFSPAPLLGNDFGINGSTDQRDNTKKVSQMAKKEPEQKRPSFSKNTPARRRSGTKNTYVGPPVTGGSSASRSAPAASGTAPAQGGGPAADISVSGAGGGGAAVSGSSSKAEEKKEEPSEISRKNIAELSTGQLTKEAIEARKEIINLNQEDFEISGIPAGSEYDINKDEKTPTLEVPEGFSNLSIDDQEEYIDMVMRQLKSEVLIVKFQDGMKLLVRAKAKLF